ncbi:MAG: DUF5132 domain-containing protein [Thermodesulfobacteriota bacterium]|nr:DUF5132 domain-containing protein [Thermodesulfobacteriota bacterium]
MGLLDELIKNKVVKGLAIGAGVYVLAPRLLPVLAETAKPLVKGIMKSGVLCYEEGKEVLAEVGESTEDLWAEVKSEMEEESRSSANESPHLSENEPIEEKSVDVTS